MNGQPPFRVAYSADIMKSDGKPFFREKGLEVLEEHPQILFDSFSSSRD